MNWIPKHTGVRPYIAIFCPYAWIYLWNKKPFSSVLETLVTLWKLSEFEVFLVRHCVKIVQIRSYFWFVFSCIWTEYRKIRTRSNSVIGRFSRSWYFPVFGLNTKIYKFTELTIIIRSQILFGQYPSH